MSIKTMALLVLLTMSGEGAGSAENPTVPEIVRAARAREDAIRNFRVRADFKEKSRSKYTGKYADAVTSMDVVIDFETGRFWYQKVAQIYNAPGGDLHDGQEFFSEIEEVMAFDGEKTRQLTWPHGEKDPDAVEALRQGHVFPGSKEYWLTDPREFVRNFLRERVSVQVSRGLATQLGLNEEGLVGIETVAPKGLSTHPDGYEFRTRYWFDRGKGMCATRREASIRRPGDSVWIPYFVTRLDDLFEISPGIWLPRKYWEESYQVLPGKAPYLVWRRDVTLSKWAINEELSDRQFKVTFPRGTMIGDQALGRTYRASVVDDRTIARMAKAAQSLSDSYQAMKNDPLPPYGPPLPPWAIAAAAVAAVLAVLWAVRKRFSVRVKEG